MELRTWQIVCLGVSFGVNFAAHDTIDLEGLSVTKQVSDSFTPAMKILSELANLQERRDHRLVNRGCLVWSKLLFGWREGEESVDASAPTWTHAASSIDYLGRSASKSEQMMHEKEPTDFRRLPEATSFLRAAFDLLVTGSRGLFPITCGESM